MLKINLVQSLNDRIKFFPRSTLKLKLGPNTRSIKDITLRQLYVGSKKTLILIKKVKQAISLYDI